MINSIEPAIDPNNRIDFLIDWELTLKCNLDCSYCPDSPEMGGGHWTLANHPDKQECINTINFLYDYTDLYMQTKQRFSRRAVLNVYGGESLLHPDIVEILHATREKHSGYDWPLTISTTTNAIIGVKRMKEIIPYIDEFTVSYHTDSLTKQREIFRKNVLEIKNSNKRIKVVMLMTNDYSKWDDLLEMIEWCKRNNVRWVPRQLDNADPAKVYNLQQLAWFAEQYDQPLESFEAGEGLTDKGRPCCGGRGMCTNGDLKTKQTFIPQTNFKDWYCSVNHFFVFVKQNDGRIFSNKDCRMNFNGKVEPIGNLNNVETLLAETRDRLSGSEIPLMKCAKTRCVCGICAPKAMALDTAKQIMKKHTVNTLW